MHTFYTRVFFLVVTNYENAQHPAHVGGLNVSTPLFMEMTQEISQISGHTAWSPLTFPLTRNSGSSIFLAQARRDIIINVKFGNGNLKSDMTVLERALNNFPQVLCLTLGLSVHQTGKVGDNGQTSDPGHLTPHRSVGSRATHTNICTGSPLSLQINSFWDIFDRSWLRAFHTLASESNGTREKLRVNF